ncbi:MAG: hypothetical protein H6581_24210 [Bacteroidia bacterium]|nr:hypothetical protein [Bacteroidia bacterium]
MDHLKLRFRAFFALSGLVLLVAISLFSGCRSDLGDFRHGCWHKVGEPPFSYDSGTISSLFFFNELEGVMVVQSYYDISVTMMRTADGGQNWVKTDSIFIGSCHAQPIFGHAQGTAYIPVSRNQADFMKIFKTTDFGFTWFKINHDSLVADLPGFLPSGDLLGTIQGNGERHLAHTVGNDSTWQLYSPQILVSGDVSVDFLPGGTGILCDRYYGPFLTTDGGITWTNFYAALNTTQQIILAGTGGNDLWVASERNIWVSTDLGATWELRLQQESVYLKDVHFLDETRVMALLLIGPEGEVIVSTDGARKFRPSRNSELWPDEFYNSRFHFLNPETGFLYSLTSVFGWEE